jgi:hypothetical protein
MFAALLAMLIAFLTFNRLDPRDRPLEYNAISSWPLLFLPFVRILGTDHFSDQRAHLLSLYPVALDEICHLGIKRELIRIMWFVPLMALYGFIVGLMIGTPVLFEVLNCVIPLGLFVCAQPIIDCYKLSNATDDTKRISLIWILWLGGGVVFFAVAMIVVVTTSAGVKVLAILGEAIISGGMYYFYRAAFHRGVFDVILKPYSE